MAALLLILLLFSGCLGADADFREATAPGIEEGNTTENTVESESAESEEQETETIEESVIEEPAFEEYDINLMAIGDNLLHNAIIKTGKMADGSYDYSFLFKGISEFINAADIKIINQETILGGNHLEFTGFPKFNSPTEVGDAIAAAGFNVVLHATNHSADQGIAGMDHCVSFWKNYPEVLMVGLHEVYPEISEDVSGNEAEADSGSRIPILTIKDIDFAILNYTYGPNYSTVPKNVRDRLEFLCAIDEKTGAIDYTTLNSQVLVDIEEAKSLADVVIVCPHWGTENSTTPSRYQEKFAMQMTEAGADLIIGTHPHVVQKAEWLEAENGNRAFCFYSLGNYVSIMKGGQNMLGALAWVSFHVTETGVTLNDERTGMLPLVCHYVHGSLRLQDVYLLEDYNEELASKHGIIAFGGISFTYQKLLEWSNEIIGERTLTREEIFSWIDDKLLYNNEIKNVID